MRLEQSFIDKLEKYIEEGYVSKRKHPEFPIYILNYTAATQFAWMWDEVTMLCRGLVIDDDYNIVARSLPKFFSYEQLDGKLPEGEFVVEEKMDGSMLLAFNYKGNLVTATRGSFESDQALGARRFIPDDFLEGLEEGITWVFEYISKENRIVVDYDFEGLVVLDVTHVSGMKMKYGFKRTLNWRVPKKYSFESLEEILNYEEDNLEGFVLHYKSGERVKIKLEEYKRLHRLITGVSEKTVWEALKDGKLPELLENVPDEFYNWVTEVKECLETRYLEIERAAKDYFKDLGDRKANALFYQHFCYPAILFHILDGRPYDQLIWKIVQPKVTTVFKMVSEESN